MKRKPYKKYGDTVKMKWYEMNEKQGFSLAHIAREFDTSIPTVSKAVKAIRERLK